MCAKINSKPAWVTLWVLAAASMLIALRALSLVKPKTCVIMCVVAFVLCVLGTFVGLSGGRTRLEIGEELVHCKKLFGREMYIPADSVSGVKKGILGTVCIYSASFKITCFFVKNREEIVELLKEKAGSTRRQFTAYVCNKQTFGVA